MKTDNRAMIRTTMKHNLTFLTALVLAPLAAPMNFQWLEKFAP